MPPQILTDIAQQYTCPRDQAAQGGKTSQGSTIARN